MSSYEDLIYEAKDGVAVISLNRPQALNAYTAAMGQSLKRAVAEAVEDAAVRVIVITGAGRGFCAGADMDALRGLGKGSTWAGSGRLTTHALSIPKPIIAAVNGACAGLGFVHALMCDLRQLGELRDLLFSPSEQNWSPM